MKSARQPTPIYLTIFAVALILAGCAVGPNFKKPAPPAVKGYTATAPTNTAAATNVLAGEQQRFHSGQDIAGDWWTLFHCKPLNDLIERSLKTNADLKAAQAALVVARENVRAQYGPYYPSVNASFNGSRQHSPETLSPVLNAQQFYFDLYTPQVNVSYSPDVFGLNRRTVESLKAQEQQARFALVATHITLSANVAVTAIQEASLREQIAATRELIDINSNMLNVLHAQFSRGYASRLAVAAQESQLAQVVATLPPLVKQLAQERDLMADLAGRYPSEEPAEKFTLADFQLPRDLPLSLPSKLVEQRPDVLQAGENLHAACANVGIAEANRLPNFLLTADVGSDALQFTKIFSSGTGFWALGGQVSQPIFEGGSLLHRQRAAQAALAQAREQYRSTVLSAFQNMADTLAALQEDAEALRTAGAARDAAKITLDLSKKQWQAGYASYLSLLSAEQAYNQAVINLIQTQANRFLDTAALFQALGGGWWNRADLGQK